MEALLPVLTSARVTVRLATACYLTIDTGPIVNKQGELVAVIETSHDVIGYKKTTMCRQLKALRGPFDVQMGQRYAHLTAKHLAPYADRLCALRQGGRGFCRRLRHLYGTEVKRKRACSLANP